MLVELMKQVQLIYYLLLVCAFTYNPKTAVAFKLIRNLHAQHKPGKIQSYIRYQYDRPLCGQTDVSDKDYVNRPITQRYVNFLVGLWKGVTFPPSDGTDITFLLSDFNLKRQEMKPFLNHFQTCKDCAADNAFLIATQNDENKDCLVLSNQQFKLLSEDYSDEEDDWGNFSEEQLGSDDASSSRPIFPVETDDQVILADTKYWVRKVIADFAVCPFTVSADRSGIPIGGVRYSLSRTHKPEEAFLRFWEEVQMVQSSDEKSIATVLLVFPELELFGNYELFEAYCDCLNEALCSMKIEDEIQLVFFHPRYQFRDGMARSSAEGGDVEAAAANFARRSPWPMINIIRTSQVRAAQRGIPTGQVYKQNEERLRSIGAVRLTEMLYSRQWEELPVISSYAKAVKALLEKEKVKEKDSDKNRSRFVVDDEESDEEYQRRKLEAIDIKVDSMNAKCPVDHSQTAQKCPINVDGDEDVSSLQKLLEADSRSDIDYLALADEVDKWLSEQ